MPIILMTGEEYVESMRAMKLQVYMFGEKVENPVDDPILRPSLNSELIWFRDFMWGFPKRTPYKKSTMKQLPKSNVLHLRRILPNSIPSKNSKPYNIHDLSWGMNYGFKLNI